MWRRNVLIHHQLCRWRPETIHAERAENNYDYNSYVAALQRHRSGIRPARQDQLPGWGPSFKIRPSPIWRGMKQHVASRLASAYWTTITFFTLAYRCPQKIYPWKIQRNPASLLLTGLRRKPIPNRNSNRSVASVAWHSRRVRQLTGLVALSNSYPG